MEGGMDREELKRLTKEEISRRIREGVKAVIEQVLEGGDAEGHGGLDFPPLPGHGPALGRGRETHKNRDLTGGAGPKDSRHHTGGRVKVPKFRGLDHGIRPCPYKGCWELFGRK
jgi:hypothetical protein